MKTNQSQTAPAEVRENIMGTMEINPLLLKLSIPMMISMLVQALYNVVDSVFVSHVSESALTAVSLAFSLQNVMIAVGVGTGVGVNALLSKSLGEKNQSRANATAENGIFLSLCSFAVFFVIGLTCMKPYFYAQTSDAVIAQQGIQYLSVCCIFSLGIFTQTMGEKLLAATGRTQLSMISQLVGAVVNIILDPIFIFGYCGQALSGTTGAAVATVIGQFCGAGMTLYFNTRKNPDIQISFKGFRPSAKAIGRIYTVGLPSIAMQCVGSLMTFGSLIKTAGMGEIDFDRKFVAIKMHFGEPGNLAFLRPNWAKTVADFVKERGGKPFLTDCNTLYVGGRKNGLDHLDTACLNGFNPMTTGCQVIIADGIKGSDEVAVPVVGGQLVKEAKIGRAVMDADVFISLTHFKGHEEAGFGGALKNIGMGCGSRAGKMEQHNAGKPHVNHEYCVGCGMCTRICAHSALSVAERKANIDHSRCVGCGRCIAICPRNAIQIDWDETVTNLNRKIAEYSKAVVDGRPCFHISLIIDVSPNCDCHAENDAAIVPNVGMFASFDPVALDMACVDAVNAQPVMRGSAADGGDAHDHDHFHRIHPETDWMSCLEHAEKIGIGTKAYELIKI